MVSLFRLTRFSLLMLAAVLGIRGGECSWSYIQLQFSGGKDAITAIRYTDAVRFTIQNEKVSI